MYRAFKPANCSIFGGKSHPLGTVASNVAPKPRCHGRRRPPPLLRGDAMGDAGLFRRNASARYPRHRRTTTGGGEFPLARASHCLLARDELGSPLQPRGSLESLEWASVTCRHSRSFGHRDVRPHGARLPYNGYWPAGISRGRDALCLPDVGRCNLHLSAPSAARGSSCRDTLCRPARSRPYQSRQFDRDLLLRDVLQPTRLERADVAIRHAVPCAAQRKQCLA